MRFITFTTRGLSTWRRFAIAKPRETTCASGELGCGYALLDMAKDVEEPTGGLEALGSKRAPEEWENPGHDRREQGDEH